MDLILKAKVVDLILKAKVKLLAESHLNLLLVLMCFDERFQALQVNCESKKEKEENKILSIRKSGSCRNNRNHAHGTCYSMQNKT